MDYAKRFYFYICKNVFGEISVAIYLVADTFFISIAEGNCGIAALNILLPVYSVIFAIGAMVGRGAAIKFSLNKKNSPDKNIYFTTALISCLVIGLSFSVMGLIFPHNIIRIMGGDGVVSTIGTSYTRIFVSFSPFFMLNFVFNAFVRNDGSPGIAMASMLISNLLNIIGDYVLMFPLKMGMAGAAVATSLAPIIGISICCFHFLKNTNTIKIEKRISLKAFFESCAVGFSSFVNQMENGIITFVYNQLLLGIAGNIAVASYGIVANVALMVNSIHTGMSNGVQPLFSEYFSLQDHLAVRGLLKKSITLVLFVSVLIYILICSNASIITLAFNGERNLQVQKYTEMGIKVYCAGFLFSGINLIIIEYFSSIGLKKPAAIASLFKGFIFIILGALILSKLYGVVGVWISFPFAEILTIMYTVYKISNNDGMNFG